MPRGKTSAAIHTHTHTHTQNLSGNADVHRINHNTSPPPLVLLSLPQSHPCKINANSVFPYLLTVHLRARYHSRVEGSKEKADSFRLSAALMSSSHCPTRIIPHLISLYSNQPYLSLVHCSFHLSRVLHPSCFSSSISSQRSLTKVACYDLRHLVTLSSAVEKLSNIKFYSSACCWLNSKLKLQHKCNISLYVSIILDVLQVNFLDSLSSKKLKIQVKIKRLLEFNM